MLDAKQIRSLRKTDDPELSYDIFQRNRGLWCENLTEAIGELEDLDQQLQADMSVIDKVLIAFYSRVRGYLLLLRSASLNGFPLS